MRLATRTELRRAHTAPEAQVRLAAGRPVRLSRGASGAVSCYGFVCQRGALPEQSGGTDHSSVQVAEVCQSSHSGSDLAAGAGSHTRGAPAAAAPAIRRVARRAAAAALAGDALCAGRRRSARQDASSRRTSERRHKCRPPDRRPPSATSMRGWSAHCTACSSAWGSDHAGDVHPRLMFLQSYRCLLQGNMPRLAGIGGGLPSAGPAAAPILPVTSAAGFYNMLSPAAAAAAVRSASSGAGADPVAPGADVALAEAAGLAPGQ